MAGDGRGCGRGFFPSRCYESDGNREAAHAARRRERRAQERRRHRTRTGRARALQGHSRHMAARCSFFNSLFSALRQSQDGFQWQRFAARPLLRGRDGGLALRGRRHAVRRHQDAPAGRGLDVQKHR